VVIWYEQQQFLLPCHPRFPPHTLTLWAVAITARIVRHSHPATTVTGIHVAAKGCCTATHYII
jgi:hypothetical protein